MRIELDGIGWLQTVNTDLPVDRREFNRAAFRSCRRVCGDAAAVEVIRYMEGHFSLFLASRREGEEDLVLGARLEGGKDFFAFFQGFKKEEGCVRPHMSRFLGPGSRGRADVDDGCRGEAERPEPDKPVVHSVPYRRICSYHRLNFLNFVPAPFED